MTLRRMHDNEVTQELSTFAVRCMRDWADSGQFFLGSTVFRDLFTNGKHVRAVVEKHTNRHPEGAPGVSLFEVIDEACPPTDPQPTPAPVERAKGVDASSYQSALDWHSVATEGYSFGFLKVHEGLTLDDGAAVSHYQGAGGAGLLRGAYTFFRVGVDAREQVHHFLDKAWTIGSAWELPCVLDVEAQGKAALGGVSPATFEQDVLDALTELAQVTGKRPLVYGSEGFFDLLPEHRWQDVAGLWVAHWEAKTPRLPHGWDRWEFWQHTAKGHVRGYPGPADLNVFRGSLSELKRAFER